MTTKINIYNPITEKNTKVNPYGRTAKDIYKIYIEDLGSDPVTVLPANLTYKNGRFIKIKPPVDFTNVRRITYQKFKEDLKIPDQGIHPSSFSYFRNIMKTYAGQTIKLVAQYPIILQSDVNMDGEFIPTEYTSTLKETIFTIPEKGFGKWWNKHSNFFMINSDEEIFGQINRIFDFDKKYQSQLLILTLDKVKKENYDQWFLDGITHCFFQPIKDWANNCEDDSKSKTAKKRYKSIINKVNKYIEKYPKGIPEEDLVLVCNDLQISVEIDLPSTMLDKGIKFIDVESQKKPLKKFRFVNTRLNHIELNEISSKDEYIEVNKKEIRKIFRESHEKGEFILWKENKDHVTQINTLTNIYKLSDEGSYNEIVKNFEEEYNFSNYKIEKNANIDLTNFLDDGLNTNQSITFLPKFKYICAADYLTDSETFEELKEDLTNPSSYDLEQPSYHEKKELVNWFDNLGDLNHIDIRKAYTQGHNCTKYQGFLGKITDFRKCNKIIGLGIYKIKNINFNGCESIQKMKCLHENHNYPSPELEFYQGLGITFDIVMGCWGSRFDFEFTPEMYQKEGGVSHYCRWYGCLMRQNDTERYNFDCKNIEYAKLNAFNSDTTIRYNYHESAGIIEYPRKYVYHSNHIASFIASYARITLLEQVLKFKDFNQIVSVVVDGIYYKGEVEVGELFSDKEKKSLFHNLSNNEYVVDYGFGDVEYESIGEYRDDNKIEVHLGAGGCGKTHAQLVDKGFVNPLFVAPSWKLARNKKSEYCIDSSVFFYLLDSDPDKWRPLMRKYSVFVVDEISMLSNEDKEKILKRFPENKIVFCGDLGYQLPPIEGSPFEIGNLPVFHHDTNYRCKCKVLEEKLLLLRKMISKNPDLRINCESIITKILKLDIIDADTIDYKVDDMIITNTNKTKDKYTDKYKHLEKYMVLENTRDFSNGEIIIGKKPEKVRAELRHGYTIYSAQGETAKHNLFIDVDKMTSLKLLYTAMSRSRTMDQIVFIK